MKKLYSAALVLALSAGSALAADLPAIKGPPPPLPPPPPMWTGFYAGVNAGGTWSNSNSVGIVSFGTGVNPFIPVPAAEYALASGLGASAILPGNSNGGFIGGGQVGYNWQFRTSFVAGIEADIQGIAGNNGNSQAAITAVALPLTSGFWVPGEFVTTALQANRRVDYLGTVRGRIGWLAMPTLLAYATGGLAYGGVRSDTNIFQFNNNQTFFPLNQFGPAFGTGVFSDTRVGWTVGGGLEWLFLPSWSAKVEYLYYDLGSVTYAVSPLTTVGFTPVPAFNGPLAVTQSVVRTRFNGNIVRVGVNYHFNFAAPAPVVARY
jgi:outer membrane immunogenic protein